MACPLCGDRCTCSFAQSDDRAGASASSSLTYERDEYCDLSERFDTEISSPPSVIPSDDAPLSERPDPGREQRASESKDAIFSERLPAPPEDLTFESERTHEEEEVGPLWKQEVASRLESYRSRRGSRRPRYNGSLSLDFERATNRMLAAAVEQDEAYDRQASAVLEQTRVAEEEQFFGAASDFDEQPEASLPQRWSPESRPEPKIIEFPRLPTLFDNAPTGNELAEAVVDKPRILYVPEEVPTAQAPLGNIQLDAEEIPDASEFDIPLKVAPMGQRMLSGIADAFIVLAGSAIFLALVFHDVPAPDSKLGYALVAVLPFLLWAIYEYLFLVHCAATPGMQMAHLALASFDAEPIGRRVRRGRALAAMLSTFPLGLGIVWALLDEDTLCWHDRISRTYIASQDPTSQD
jgi:uncharacterized RDD family membrane protein YckC